MFWQLQYYGCRDERFSHENFGNQTDTLIFQALDFYTRRWKLDLNTQSKTHAIGWSGLFNGFGGKDAAKMEPWQLLPFPDLAETKVKRLSSKTAHILASLIEGGSLPQRIAGTVRQFDEIVELIDEAS